MRNTWRLKPVMLVIIFFLHKAGLNLAATKCVMLGSHICDPASVTICDAENVEVDTQ